jgi:hypothetical protein
MEELNVTACISVVLRHMSDTEQVFNVKCLCYIVCNLVHLLLCVLPSHCCILCLMQKLKTKVVKKNLNPEWNDELTLSISDPRTPIHLVSNFSFNSVFGFKIKI